MFKIIFGLLFVIVIVSLTYLLFTVKNQNHKVLDKMLLYKQIFPKHIKKTRIFLTIVVLLGSLLMLFNVGYGKELVSSGSKNLAVYFVIDNSMSMLALDYDVNKSKDDTRLQAAKDFSIDIADKNAGEKLSLISFGSSAFTDVPLTQDRNSFDNAIYSLYPSSNYSQKGSNINSGIIELNKRLESNNTEDKIVVFIITDGENNTVNNNIDSLKKKNIETYVIGVGTEKGANIIYTKPDYNGDVNLKPIKDFYGKTIVSKYNPEYNEKLASEVSAKLYRVENLKNLSEVVKKIEPFNAKEQKTKKANSYKSKPIYWIIALALIPIFFATKYLWIQRVKPRSLKDSVGF